MSSSTAPCGKARDDCRLFPQSLSDRKKSCSLISVTVSPKSALFVAMCCERDTSFALLQLGYVYVTRILRVGTSSDANVNCRKSEELPADDSTACTCGLSLLLCRQGEFFLTADRDAFLIG